MVGPLSAMSKILPGRASQLEGWVGSRNGKTVDCGPLFYGTTKYVFVEFRRLPFVTIRAVAEAWLCDSQCCFPPKADMSRNYCPTGRHLWSKLDMNASA